MTITIWYCHVDHRTWVFVWHGSKQTEDLSVRLAAASTSFQTCRWGVEIGEGHWDTFESFDSYTKAQKLSILALRMQKRFCNTRKLKRTKTEKKKPKTENRVEVWSQRTLSNAKTAISPVRTTWCWFLRTDDFLDCFWSAPRCCACPAKRPCPRPERRRPWSTWSGKTNVWNFLKVLCMPKMLLKNDRFLLQVLLLLWLYSLLSSILLSLILV